MIEKYIKELLFTSDLLAIPGFGCFVCSYAEAELNSMHNKIFPPTKKIAFNEKIQTGDSEKLISYIAEKEKITAEETKSELFRYAGEIKYKISIDKQYIFEELGRFYVSKDGTIAFEQFNRFNYLEDSFGLPHLFIRPIEKNNIFEPTIANFNNPKFLTSMKIEDNTTNNLENAEVDSDLEYIESVKKSSNSLTWYYLAASVCLLLVLGTSYYLNMDKETYAIGTFNPFSFLKVGNSESFSNNDVDISQNKLLPENINVDDNQLTTNTDNNLELENETKKIENLDIQTQIVVTQQKIIPEQKIDLSNAITTETGRYYLIVGSFKKQNIAQNLLNTLASQGLDAKIVAQNGNTETIRISASDFETYEEANAKKISIAEQTGTSSWILKY